MLNTKANTSLKKKLFLCLIILLIGIKLSINMKYSYADVYFYLIVQLILILINISSYRFYFLLIALEVSTILLFKQHFITSNAYYLISFGLTLLGILYFLKPSNINQYRYQPIHLYLHHTSIATLFLVLINVLINVRYGLSEVNPFLEFTSILIQIYILVYSVLTLINYLKHNLFQTLMIDFIKEKEYSEITKQILHFFETSTPVYLNPSFNIDTLSQEIGVPVHEISKKINNELNTNYYNLVAFYRIQQATKRMKEKPNHKIEVIAEDCGFNSRGTFTKYFKQFLKCTPTEYRNKMER